MQSTIETCVFILAVAACVCCWLIAQGLSNIGEGLSEMNETEPIRSSSTYRYLGGDLAVVDTCHSSFLAFVKKAGGDDVDDKKWYIIANYDNGSQIFVDKFEFEYEADELLAELNGKMP